MKTPAFARSLRWLIDAGDGSWSRLSSDGGPPAICTWISPRKSGQAQCFLKLERTIPSLVSQAKRANISFLGAGGTERSTAWRNAEAYWTRTAPCASLPAPLGHSNEDCASKRVVLTATRRDPRRSYGGR